MYERTRGDDVGDWGATRAIERLEKRAQAIKTDIGFLQFADGVVA